MARVRRIPDWKVSVFTTVPVQILNATTLLAANVSMGTIAGQACTHARIRGELIFRPQSNLVNVELGAAIGIGYVAPTAAAALTAATVPQPAGDSIWDGWLYHRWCYGSWAGVAGQTAHSKHGIHVDLDSKAMRKVDEDDVLIMVVQNVQAAAADDIEISFGFRVLYLES